MIDNVALPSTPAVPRSNRLNSNLVNLVAALVSVWPEVYPTKLPAATCS